MRVQAFPCGEMIAHGNGEPPACALLALAQQRFGRFGDVGEKTLFFAVRLQQKGGAGVQGEIENLHAQRLKLPAQKGGGLLQRVVRVEKRIFLHAAYQQQRRSGSRNHVGTKGL